MTAQREKDLDAACGIDGWLTRAEALALHGLACNARAPIVEIGSWQGRSTAALALGALSGTRQPVYAIDSFVGPQEGARGTSLGNTPDCGRCSPALLRANLYACGVDVSALVRIVPKPSQEALGDVPREIGLLFIDGAHDYESVCRDVEHYLPRVKLGGFAVFHDVRHTDPGVVRAVDEHVRSRPNDWRIIDHVDSALVVRRVSTPRRAVVLMCPGRGYDWGTVTGIVQSTLGAHRVDLDNNGNGWDDFNHLWARALNRFELGEATHAAMLHADVVPQPGFVDLLMDEMHELNLDLLSVACSMKDRRAVCNCGIGRTDNRWGAWRRVTVAELAKLPPTFTLDDLAARGFCGPGEPKAAASDKVLLHNTGCFLVNLAAPCFVQTDAAGDLVAWFDFPTKIRRDPGSGRWINMRESEDWFFSRQLATLGARTAITSKVHLGHEGKSSFGNRGTWGDYQDGDTDTRPLWQPGWKAPC